MSDSTEGASPSNEFLSDPPSLAAEGKMSENLGGFIKRNQKLRDELYDRVKQVTNDPIAKAKEEGWDGKFQPWPEDELTMFVLQAGCGGIGCVMDRMEVHAACRFLDDYYGLDNE